jgi:DNA or RNA helicases of superfamily II
MIVIDEAHHALAKTYKGMWDRFPKAKFLGLTATPCRLNGKGFTDLFDVLVQSWSVPEFISKGRLATYDFVSIKSDGVTQRLIDSLQKRGADGDYQNKEMDMLLNKKPSIERLYRSLEEFGKDRKGIVYAINIRHANAIAEFYREHGIAAVAIDSKTPSSLRKELIERFKASNLSFSNHPVPLSKEGIFRITPSLFPKRAPPLTPTLSPSGEREETALLGARNRYALRMADHQRSRQIVRDGTAWVLLACDLLIMLAIDWVLLACGLLMNLLLYRCW